MNEVWFRCNKCLVTFSVDIEDADLEKVRSGTPATCSVCGEKLELTEQQN